MSSNGRLLQNALPVTALAWSESAPGQLADKANIEPSKTNGEIDERTNLPLYSRAYKGESFVG